MSEILPVRNNSKPAGKAAIARRNPLNWLILGGALLIAFIVVGTAIAVISFRQRALEDRERELHNTVLLLTRHFDRELQNFEAVQADLVRRIERFGLGSPEAFRRQISTEGFHKNLEAVVGALSDTAGINIFDATGQLINSSRSWPVPDISIADRSYFESFAADSRSPTVSIALVNGRFSGGWTTVLARKIASPSGEFLGVVTRGLSPANLESFFESLELGKGSAITVLHRDGTLLARFPHIERMIGQNFKTAPVSKILSEAGHGTMRLISPVDGEDRLAAVRALSKFPISIIATSTVATALTDWRAQTRFLVAAAGLAALVIAFTLFFIVRNLSKQHNDSERTLALQKERLDTAINNMTQGLLLYDSDARIVLCNQRYLEMYNLDSDVIKPGSHLRDIIGYRKQTGSFHGDPDEFCSAILRNVAEKRMTHNVVQTPGDRSILIVNKPLANGGWVTTLEDITERRRADERIAHLAHYDALTGLPNRVLFREQIERELQRTGQGEQFALLYIDIDEFKGINDSLGHHVGDELLKAVADRIRGCIGESDLIARLGGDEFAVIQTGVRNVRDAVEFVTRIHESIRQPYQCLGHQLSTDASIGIALAPQDGTDLDQLIKNADLAMYGAKAGGRRTHRFFEPAMDANAKARLTLEQDLRQALVDGDFEIHYQPLVNLRHDEVTGCEALLRWRHSERGMISPAEFIPVAEDTGLIVELGDWVLRTACAEAASWPDHIRIAVNVSPVQLKCPTLALNIASALANSGLQAGRLEIEITETVLIHDDETALSILHQLRDIGVRIALDDFGTGYSSLSYLKRFPFDKIKIDRSFVSDIAEIDGSAAIVQAVINIAVSRNMTTTAEGVETLEQKERLRALGCTEMQGYLFSAAKPGPEVRQLFGPRDQTAAAVA
ncbi:MAG: EAL domain-containing protein [Bradyrhizobium sp.]|uniref:bifunctional diguanylate cyclase/phosphodiesterase n=1 Tax=Bradyrhizobium sp. TaxID=376 RepID=UPI002724AD60|nr:EAL domain-containing protein [Bradyrhizobium sp.]MDO8399373.1 EAL domain-containing protein [Bradyrhizobium sp.]